jgi:hypothetical protein
MQPGFPEFLPEHIKEPLFFPSMHLETQEAVVDPKRPVESFCRLYDDILENVKVATLTPEAFGLYCALMVYCHRNDTDGAIPSPRARGLLDFTESEADYDSTLSELVEARLVDRVSPTLLGVHDYLLHNNSHDEREAAREAKRVAGQAGGQASAQARAQAKLKQVLKQNPSTSQAKEKEKEKETTNALSASPNGLRLGVLMEPLLGHALSAVDIQNCDVALSEYRYLTGVDHFAKRAGEHNLYCQGKNWPQPKTIEGYFDCWRRENDYMADVGGRKSRPSIDTGLTKITPSDLLKVAN